MNGTITKRARKNGKPSWGYYLLAGVDENGKRIQPTKSGFRTKTEADAALSKAIAEHLESMEALKNPPPEVSVTPALPSFAAFFNR
jgi:hypothetical protein